MSELTIDPQTKYDPERHRAHLIARVERYETLVADLLAIGLIEDGDDGTRWESYEDGLRVRSLIADVVRHGA